MPGELIVPRSFEAGALLEQRVRLAAARAVLAGRETKVARVRARLQGFEARYLREVGVLYAELDDLEARIAEREAALYDSDAARRRAEEARRRARETHAAAFNLAEEPKVVDPPPGLKTLFREVARRIHPDRAGDEGERQFFTLLMARANLAYSRGDTEILERLLEDSQALDVSAAAANEGDTGAEVGRLQRQISQAERDVAGLDAEEAMLLASELGLLSREAEEAAAEGRDLVAELAVGLQAQIADAQYRLRFTERQVDAHGR